MKPLTSWTCDDCGNLIERAADGEAWFDRDENDSFGHFEILHKRCTPSYDQFKSTELTAVLGPEGQSLLLSLLSLGPLMPQGDLTRGVDSLDEYVDFFRRLQTPWYEEARRYFGNGDVQDEYSGGATEARPYEPSALLNIIRLGQASE